LIISAEIIGIEPIMDTPNSISRIDTSFKAFLSLPNYDFSIFLKAKNPKFEAGKKDKNGLKVVASYIPKVEETLRS